MKSISVFILLLFIPSCAWSQGEDSLQHNNVNRKALKRFAIISGTTYGAGLVALNQLWYANNDRQSFRFFNDNAEWKQVDKLGHFYSAFYLSYVTSSVLKAHHVKPGKAALAGAITGFALLVPIEVFDGYSAAYGASVGDLIADAAGAGFYFFQEAVWGRVRIYPKYSFQRSGYANQRPDVLGKNLSEQFIKDYNGQTYWFSFDMDQFVTFPKWLNIAVGYGANQMIYARDEQHVQAGLPLPFRQWYISLDPDLTSIRSRSKVIKTLLFVANAIKIPAPALSLDKNGLRFNVLQF